MKTLTSSQRKKLSSAAHSLNPTVQIGQNGLTDSVTEQVNRMLTIHELIKVKFVDFKDEKNKLSETLAKNCNAALVRIIGNIAILYRPAKKADERKYGIVFD